MRKILEEDVCRDCGGSGTQTCGICKGEGHKMIYKNPLPNVFPFVTYSFPEVTSCYKCHSTGQVPCKHCKGTGKKLLSTNK